MSIAAGLDVSTANMARVYDYWRGGRESFPADRDQAAAIEALYPPGTLGPRELVARNRTFLERAVCASVHDGIGQVLDLGAGFPGPGPLHEVAQHAKPGARCAYVDTDPLVVSHGQALTAGIAGVAYARADLGNPATVLADPDVLSVIDPARPAVVVLGLVLHFLPAADAGRVIEGWAGWLAPGSRLVITTSHWTDEGAQEQGRAAYGPAPVYNHSVEDLAGMLRGLDLPGPGIVIARGWCPEELEPAGPGRVLAVVARKP